MIDVTFLTRLINSHQQFTIDDIFQGFVDNEDKEYLESLIHAANNSYKLGFMQCLNTMKDLNLISFEVDNSFPTEDDIINYNQLIHGNRN